MKMACWKSVAANRWGGAALLVVAVGLGVPGEVLGNVYKSRVNAQWADDN